MTLHRDLRAPAPPRSRPPDRAVTFSLWLGYLSFGGALSLAALNDGLAGRTPISDVDLYLLAQAHNV